MQDFLPSDHLFSDCICEGTGQAWKYFKTREEKAVKVSDYCPVCHPNLAQPILPGPGQTEIGYSEFAKLNQTAAGG